jgi:hypothetical protein
MVGMRGLELSSASTKCQHCAWRDKQGKHERPLDIHAYRFKPFID